VKTLASGTVTLIVDVKGFDARNILFFDRCSVYQNGTFAECHFGFYGAGRELQRGLIALIPQRVLTEAKESLLNYVQTLGQPEMTELPVCKIRGEGANVIPVDVIGLAHVGNREAEILFHTYSTKVAVEHARSAENAAPPISALCTALLRCDIDLQKRWIISLYEAGSED
jgi:hypothetical protein